MYPEIEAVVPNNPYRQQSVLYKNNEGRELQKVGYGESTPHSGRGLAVGDYDNDGDVDVFINNMNERPSLLRNDSPPAGGFLAVRLVGGRSNRSAIGARVTVTAGDRKIVQEVRSGSSFMSSSDLRLHFGLGAHESVDRIDVDWPYDTPRDTAINVAANQFIEITEGKGVTARK